MPGSARAIAAQLHNSCDQWESDIKISKGQTNLQHRRSTDKLEHSQKWICLASQDITNVSAQLYCPKEQQIRQGFQANQTSKSFTQHLFPTSLFLVNFAANFLLVTVQKYSKHRPHQGGHSQPFGASLPLCLLALCLFFCQPGLQGGHGPSRGGVHISHL